MIAVDTNILVYAHRPDAISHVAARNALASLISGDTEWAITWPSIHEFISTVTRSIYVNPTPLDIAFEQVTELFRGNVVLLGERSGHLATLRRLAEVAEAVGPRIHDARIAAICIDHGVSELWTADRDFRKFSGLRLRNPLV